MTDRDQPTPIESAKRKRNLRPGQGKGESPTSPRRVAGTLNQAAAVELRLRGLTYERIAEEVGYADGKRAQEAVEAALRKTITPPAEELRTLELLRLDDQMSKMHAMQDATWEAATTGIPIFADKFVELDDGGREVLEQTIVGYRPNLSAIETYLKTIDTFLKLSKRRADLFGMDAPKRIMWDDVRKEAEKVREQLVAAGIAADNTELRDIIDMAERIAMGEA